MKNKILALMLALAMVLTCMPMMAFAEDGISYEDISFSSKTEITFGAEEYSRFFKFNVPESGLYRMNLYQDYAASYNDYSYFVLRESPDLDTEVVNDLYWGNFETMEDDYHLFKLNAGTYYMEIQCFEPEAQKNKIAFDFQKTDGYELSYNPICYVGQQLWIGAYNVDTDEDAKIDSMLSSDKTIISIKTNTWEEDGVVEKYFEIKAKKVGTAKVTVEYITPDGTKCQREATIKVKKYPAQIKTLKVNGKKVNVSKKKYNYSKGNFKSTKTTVQVALKKGWKVTGVWAYKYTKSGKEVKLVKNEKAMKKLVKKLNSGKAISFKFEKKYVDMHYGFTMEKGNSWLDYDISLYR